MGYTLTFYFIRNFLKWVGIGFFTCSLLIFLADTVELLRKSADLDLSFNIITQIAFMRLPNLIQEIAPFAFLFGAILFFTRINRRLEIVITRASGVSIWQLLVPTIVTSLVIGVLLVVAFNPLAAAMNSRASELTDTYFESEVSRVKVLESGLWLKQINGDKSETLINASSISADNRKFRKITIFELSKQNQFLRRIDAKVGFLVDSRWQFKDVIINRPNELPEKIDYFEMPTNLTLLQIQESFSEPQALSFWELPKFITVLEASGFSALRHKLHLNTLLTMPILLAAMVLIASVFSVRFSRQNKNGLLVAGAVLTGFVFYFITKLIASFGIAGNMPIIVAAWSPAVMFIIIGIWLQLIFEDS